MACALNETTTKRRILLRPSLVVKDVSYEIIDRRNKEEYEEIGEPCETWTLLYSLTPLPLLLVATLPRGIILLALVRERGVVNL